MKEIKFKRGGKIRDLPLHNVITFEDGCFCLDHVSIASGHFQGIKVIGNIYENPELLGEK